MTDFVLTVFYYNCRLNGKTALLAGPFISPDIAEACGEFVGPACVDEHPESRKATFGVVEVKAPGTVPGTYNRLLPSHLMGQILLDTGIRQ